MKDIKVMLFDDNAKILDSMSLLLETHEGFDVCGTFANVLNCIEEVSHHNPDIVLMDIDMPGLNGLEGLKIIIKKFPDLPVLMLTSFDDEQKVYTSLRNGARGYLLKSMSPDIILQSIKEAYYGGVPMSDRVAKKVLDYFRKDSKGIEHYHLTEREIEVLRLLVSGKSYQQVADSLIISYETVRTHIKHLYNKLGVSTLAEAVVKAVKEELID
ncbi:MAG: response regulator transcription factor [Bacteroidia bacterium]